MHNDTLPASLLDECADRLWEARAQARFSVPPSDAAAGFDLAAGYAVGQLLHQRLTGAGHRTVGRKLGFTNPATWEEFNLDTPIWAHVYDQTVRWADDGMAGLAIDTMIAPRIEPEIVLHLGKDVSTAAANAEALVAHIDWAAIAFEIVDCHYPRWHLTAPDAVADFGVHAALVIGPRFALNRQDPVATLDSLSRLQVYLRRGDQPVATGCGANALGNPVSALAHIAGVLAGQPWAPPLTAGELISTGTLTPPPEITVGDRWSVEASLPDGRTRMLTLDC